MKIKFNDIKFESDYIPTMHTLEQQIENHHPPSTCTSNEEIQGPSKQEKG